MNIPKPVALLLALAALAYFKPWEGKAPTPSPNGEVPWITPYAAPADPSALNAIRAEAKKAPVAAGVLAGCYQIFGDMIESDSQTQVIRSGADVKRAAEMALKLVGGKPGPVPRALFDPDSTTEGLISQYVTKQVGRSPGALTPELRQKLAKAYRDVAWALEQES